LQVTDADASSTENASDTDRELVGDTTGPSETNGAVPSTVHDRLAEPVLPAASVALTTTVCAPSASPDAKNGLVQAAATTESSLQVTDANASSTENASDTDRELVGDTTAPSETTGAVPSTVHDRLAEPVLPAASVAETTSVCEPSPSPDAWNGLVQAAAAAESSLQVTDADASSTENASDTDREFVGDTTAPSETTGAVPSTVHDRLAEPTLPAASVAETTSVCEPSPSPDAWNGLEHKTAAAESSLHVTAAAGSSTVKAMDAERDLVSAVTDAIETTGAVPSTVHDRLAEPTIPAASFAETTSVWAPSASPDARNGLEQGAAVPPSMAHVTEAGPPLTVKPIEMERELVSADTASIVTTGCPMSTVHEACAGVGSTMFAPRTARTRNV
jgi:hypothetical protein